MIRVVIECMPTIRLVARHVVLVLEAITPAIVAETRRSRLPYHARLNPVSFRP